MNWPQLVSNLQICSAILSIILNSILLILIIKKTPKKLGSYRYLMIYFATFEIFFSILDVFLSPRVISHGYMAFVVISTKNAIFFKTTYLILNCVWCGFIGSFMALFAIQYIYRFCVVSGSKKVLKSFNDYRLTFWMSIPVIYGILWGLNIYFLMGPNFETDQAIKDLLILYHDMKLDETSYIGLRCYEQSENDQSYIINYNSILSIVITLVMTTTSFICVIFFAVGTFWKIRKTLQIMSKQENNLQLQTFYALVSQTIIPMILMHFPCTIVLISAVLNVYLGHISDIVSVSFALFPALDPLPVMLIIKNFRGTLFNVVTAPVKIFVRRNNPI